MPTFCHSGVENRMAAFIGSCLGLGKIRECMRRRAARNAMCKTLLLPTVQTQP